MTVRDKLMSLPLARQLTVDRHGLGRAAKSKGSESFVPRIRDAEVAQSICPYCAVGCGQRVYHRDGEVIQIEGDPDSPISRGRLCPKGAASEQLVNNPLEQAMDMIADRLVSTRERTWEHETEMNGERTRLNRTLGFAHLGGATLDNEENYLIKKLFTAMGAVQIENQARI